MTINILGVGLRISQPKHVILGTRLRALHGSVIFTGSDVLIAVICFACCWLFVLYLPRLQCVVVWFSGLVWELLN